MRRILVISIFLSLAAGVFALPGRASGPRLIGPWGPAGFFWMGADPASIALNSEIAAILDQNAQAQLGTMTVGDVEKLAGQIAIAIQKEEYVRQIDIRGRMIPSNRPTSPFVNTQVDNSGTAP